MRVKIILPITVFTPHSLKFQLPFIISEDFRTQILKRPQKYKKLDEHVFFFTDFY